MQAVGAYLETLQKERKLTDMDVATRARERSPQYASKMAPNYIWRLRTGRMKSPGIGLLAVITDVVGGSFDEVQHLLLETGATEELGERLAREFLVSGTSRIRRAALELRDRDAPYQTDPPALKPR
jgi:transcriptional regulator with XRE-family HTH domain